MRSHALYLLPTANARNAALRRPIAALVGNPFAQHQRAVHGHVRKLEKCRKRFERLPPTGVHQFDRHGHRVDQLVRSIGSERCGHGRRHVTAQAQRDFRLDGAVLQRPLPSARRGLPHTRIGQRCMRHRSLTIRPTGFPVARHRICKEAQFAGHRALHGVGVRLAGDRVGKRAGVGQNHIAACVTQSACDRSEWRERRGSAAGHAAHCACMPRAANTRLDSVDKCHAPSTLRA